LKLIKKRIVEDKENKSRVSGKNVGNERKTSSTLTAMYDDDEGTSTNTLLIHIDDELSMIVPKKTRKPSKPKGIFPYKI
jgi:hypothetical protein